MVRDDKDDEGLSKDFGERLRQRRNHLALTLEELSRRSGVSTAMLSKVERGEKSPTIGIASKIAQALHTSLSYLATGDVQKQSVFVVRKHERYIFKDADTGFERHILSPVVAGSTIEFLQHHLPANASTGLLASYPSGTEKYLVVTLGLLIVKIGEEEIHLEEGDSLFFEANVEHSFSSNERQVCDYILVVSRR